MHSRERLSKKKWTKSGDRKKQYKWRSETNRKNLGGKNKSANQQRSANVSKPALAISPVSLGHIMLPTAAAQPGLPPKATLEAYLQAFLPFHSSTFYASSSGLKGSSNTDWQRRQQDLHQKQTRAVPQGTRTTGIFDAGSYVKSVHYPQVQTEKGDQVSRRLPTSLIYEHYD